MSDDTNTRRQFLKTTSAAMAGASLASVAGAETAEVDASKILNYYANLTPDYRWLHKWECV